MELTNEEEIPGPNFKECFVHLEKLNVEENDSDSSCSLDLPALPYLLKPGRSRPRSKKSNEELLAEHQSLADNIKVDIVSNTNMEEKLRTLEIVQSHEEEEPQSSAPLLLEDRNRSFFCANDSLQFFSNRDVTPLACGYEFCIEVNVFEKEMLSFKRAELENVISSFLFSCNAYCISECKSFVTFLLKNMAVCGDPASVYACYNALNALLLKHDDAQFITFSSAEIFMLLFNYGIDMDNFRLLQLWPDVRNSLEVPQCQSKNFCKIPVKWTLNLKMILKSVTKLISTCHFKEQDLCQIIIFFLWMCLDPVLLQENLYSTARESISASLESILPDEWKKTLYSIANFLMLIEFPSPEKKWYNIFLMTETIPSNSKRGIELRREIAFLALKYICFENTQSEANENYIGLNLEELQHLLQKFNDIRNELLSYATKFVDICITHLNAEKEDYQDLCDILRQCESCLHSSAYEAKAHFLKIHAKLKIVVGKNTFYTVSQNQLFRKIKQEVDNDDDDDDDDEEEEEEIEEENEIEARSVLNIKSEPVNEFVVSSSCIVMKKERTSDMSDYEDHSEESSPQNPQVIVADSHFSVEDESTPASKVLSDDEKCGSDQLPIQDNSHETEVKVNEVKPKVIAISFNDSLDVSLLNMNTDSSIPETISSNKELEIIEIRDEVQQEKYNEEVVFVTELHSKRKKRRKSDDDCVEITNTIGLNNNEVSFFKANSGLMGNVKSVPAIKVEPLDRSDIIYAKDNSISLSDNKVADSLSQCENVLNDVLTSVDAVVDLEALTDERTSADAAADLNIHYNVNEVMNDITAHVVEESVTFLSKEEFLVGKLHIPLSSSAEEGNVIVVSEISVIEDNSKVSSVCIDNIQGSTEEFVEKNDITTHAVEELATSLSKEENLLGKLHVPFSYNSFEQGNAQKEEKIILEEIPIIEDSPKPSSILYANDIQADTDEFVENNDDSVVENSVAISRSLSEDKRVTIVAPEIKDNLLLSDLQENVTCMINDILLSVNADENIDSIELERKVHSEDDVHESTNKLSETDFESADKIKSKKRKKSTENNYELHKTRNRLSDTDFKDSDQSESKKRKVQEENSRELRNTRDMLLQTGSKSAGRSGRRRRKMQKENIKKLYETRTRVLDSDPKNVDRSDSKEEKVQKENSRELRKTRSRLLETSSRNTNTMILRKRKIPIPRESSHDLRKTRSRLLEIDSKNADKSDSKDADKSDSKMADKIDSKENTHTENRRGRRKTRSRLLKTDSKNVDKCDLKEEKMQSENNQEFHETENRLLESDFKNADKRDSREEKIQSENLQEVHETENRLLESDLKSADKNYSREEIMQSESNQEVYETETRLLESDFKNVDKSDLKEEEIQSGSQHELLKTRDKFLETDFKSNDKDESSKRKVDPESIYEPVKKWKSELLEFDSIESDESKDLIVGGLLSDVVLSAAILSPGKSYKCIPNSVSSVVKAVVSTTAILSPRKPLPESQSTSEVSNRSTKSLPNISSDSDLQKISKNVSEKENQGENALTIEKLPVVSETNIDHEKQEYSELVELLDKVKKFVSAEILETNKSPVTAFPEEPTAEVKESASMKSLETKESPVKASPEELTAEVKEFASTKSLETKKSLVKASPKKHSELGESLAKVKKFGTTKPREIYKSPIKVSPKKSEFFNYFQRKQKYISLKKKSPILTSTGLHLTNILRDKVMPSSVCNQMKQEISVLSDDSELDVTELYTDPKRYADKECLVIFESENVVVLDSD